MNDDVVNNLGGENCQDKPDESVSRRGVLMAGTAFADCPAAVGLADCLPYDSLPSWRSSWQHAARG